MGQVRRRERKWVLIVAGLIVAASTLPYLAGYLAQNAEWRFGGALMDPVDYYSHLARMWQGYRGEWKYVLLFTPEPHDGVYLLAFHVALGHLAHLASISLPLTYQIARVGFGFLMLLAVYRFIALFVSPVRTRRVAFLLATLVSGLGWLTEPIAPTPPSGISPMDFWLLDAFTYLAVLVFPHFSAAIGLLLTTYILLLRRPGGPNLLDGGLAVLSSFALGIIHPYALLLADLVPLLYWGAEWLQSRRLNWRGVIVVAAMTITQLPLLAYHLWVFRTQPVFAGWSAQNVTLSPPFQTYLWGYGVLLALGVVGTVTWARRGWQGLAFPLIWIGLVAILTRLPWNMQRRFLEGVQVPLGLLAGVGLAEGLFPVARGQQFGRLRWMVMALLIGLAAMSNLYLTTGYTVAAAARSPTLFWPAELLAGVDWLAENTSPEDTILSAVEVGNLIPGRIGHRVVLGHPMETLEYQAKRDAVVRFFADATPDEERIRLLEQHGVEYVFYGSNEQALGGFQPSSAHYLSPVFDGGDVLIYKVLSPTR